ncbi:MAG: DUF655 domain-containing protein [Candidatus Aenigmatarchaeota archaeon]|nr:MAG: DUF655 domain-containing protein [Candidatus Aenigmarchaeota archaeon]
MNEKDEWAIVLDFLPHGHSGYGRPEPVAEVVGERFFSLLEIVPREGVVLTLGDRVYIGDGPRDKVKYVKRALKHSDLSTSASSELEEVIKDIVREAEERFIEFFNNAGPLSIRMHSLELLPGMGKKHTWEVLEARKEKPFASYEDMKARCPALPEPKKMLEKRIIKEVRGEDPHHALFVRAHEMER